MTQEDKQLLLKDLCARLPYGVQILYDFEKRFDGGLICQPLGLTKINGKTYITAYGVIDPIGFDEFKPCLRSMSSMTEDEYNEYSNYILNEKDELIKFCNSLSFYGRYHFDYRGMIDKGLALEAPEDMYK